MNRNRLAGLSLLLIAAMVASAVAAGSGLPAEMRLPIHWDLSGRPDNYAGKWVALLMPAGMTAVVALLGWFLPVLEPRARNLARSRGLYLWSWAAMLLLGTVIHIVLLSTALGWNLPTQRLIVGACGLLLVLIGNQLGKSRSMYMMGLRTPWTLASEEVWVRTQRLSGKLMLLIGVAIILSALLPLPTGPTTTILLGLVLCAAVVTFVYSWLLWRRQPPDHTAADQSSE